MTFTGMPLQTDLLLPSHRSAWDLDNDIFWEPRFQIYSSIISFVVRRDFSTDRSGTNFKYLSDSLEVCLISINDGLVVTIENTHFEISSTFVIAESKINSMRVVGLWLSIVS